MEKLQLLKEEAIQAIENSSTLVELQEKRVLYLGKKGPIQDVMKTMKDLAPEDRPAFGAQVNEIKKTISELIETKKVELEEKEMLAQLEKEKIDITLEGYNCGKCSSINFSSTRIRRLIHWFRIYSCGRARS